LTKLSIVFWFAALATSASLYARWLFARTETRLAAAAALILASPFLYWQIVEDWQFLEFVRAYNDRPPEAMVVENPLFGLIATMNPLFAVVWVPGLVYGIVARDASARALGTAAAICLVLFLAAGVKFYFTAPLFVVFSALGAILWERQLDGRRTARASLVAVLAASGALAVPIAAPVLPPDRLQQLCDFIRDGEQGRRGEAPAAVGRYFPHFAEMHGWPELVDEVARRYERIPASERDRVEIVAAHFGQAGALNQLDAEDRLPEAYSGHVNYHLWSSDAAFEEVLFVGFAPEEIGDLYADVQLLGRVRCERCTTRDNGISILRARSLKADAETVRRRIRRLYFF
jgi:hypothetical protein